jgi:hypothetical protein
MIAEPGMPTPHSEVDERGDIGLKDHWPFETADKNELEVAAPPSAPPTTNSAPASDVPPQVPEGPHG